MSITAYRQAIAEYGFNPIQRVLDQYQVAALRAALQSAIRGRTAKDYAMRRLLELIPTVHQLCSEVSIRALVEPILGSEAFPVRGIFFDKNPEANWSVSWHQDLTIAVRQRVDTPGFGSWSIKDDVHHVQPPISILEGMLSLRIHLDDADLDNAPLLVLPGSHRQGRLQPETIHSKKACAVACPVPCGGVLVMKPLLVHASRRARTPAHRRVIHIEFAAENLPNGLQWYGS
ncbi:phytanoyl-CoA dioxygenase family protein [Microcoleus sp. FACHB-831]|uniref:phytanoyl-CoA dioxygenase family protein n=1 Tax=Microcoleus sp. FACHB-831 TaxID=2692827 RepID=UPI00168A253F|nr:phytanoyl-CoA dioxygenase family protein [Microcoleus sp. FACHB-831]MBD1921857.1 phytanoyl-CoA dioxygenase family protein [Microcoleus sp. FACHB-831]